MNIPKGFTFDELHKWIIGKRFGRLMVTEYDKRGTKGPRWKCMCDCGKECSRTTSNLREPKDHSCRCWGIEKCSTAGFKHGYHKSAEYAAYYAMKSRCYHPKAREYRIYGGRGITVCDRWLESFENFIADMGSKPAKNYSLDRINSNGNYEPENCRWADPVTQSNNTSRNKHVVLDGVRATVAEHCRRTGAKHWTVHYRLKKGMSPEEAFKQAA